MIPEPIKKFIDYFSKLPSIGPRMATRLAFYIASLDQQTRQNLLESFQGLQSLTRCERCFFLKSTDSKWCAICMNSARDKNTIMIVERETDLLAIEKTQNFKGHYLLLGELPDRGIIGASEKLRLQELKRRITEELSGKAKEIIIALNLNPFGDFTAGIIREEFKTLAEKITRIGRGIPTGGEIEFADEDTLESALERRI